MQTVKFASEAGVIVRSQVPTLTHWKQYMKSTENFDGFMGRLSGRLAIDTSHKATEKVCANVFKSSYTAELVLVEA